MSIQNHLDLLGRPVRDKVSGFTGTVTSICFDLFGCVQAVVAPSSEGHHEVRTGAWFDVSRLQTTGEAVMNAPDFMGDNAQARGEQGAADKPAGRY